MALAIGLVMGWPWILGPKPAENASVEAKLSFLKGGGVIVGFTILFLAVAMAGSMIIARLAREDYAAEVDSNLSELIAGTQDDLKKKKNDHN